MDMRFTVGEIAKMNGITKQMLIFYDREGVFCPKYVDPSNGYRYYTADQLEVLDSILILRETGMSLREIKAHFNSRNGLQTLETLKEQLSAVKEKISWWNTIQERLQFKIDSLESYYSGQPIGFVIECQNEYLSVAPVGGAQGLLDLDIALKELLQTATKGGYPHFYQIGGMVSLKNLLQGNFFIYEYGFLPLYHLCASGNIQIKPAGMYACVHHHGPYKEIGMTYKAMLEEIERRGYRPCSGSYEFCVLDSLTSNDPNEYITEVHIRVEKVE